MLDKKEAIRVIQEELKGLLTKSFPKVCTSCGARYDTLEDFLENTEPVPSAHGLFDSLDYEDRSVVDLIRNCACGSTLMIAFRERRDMSERGVRVREAFAKLLAMMEQDGIPKDVARAELLGVVRGEPTGGMDTYASAKKGAAVELLNILQSEEDRANSVQD